MINAPPVPAPPIWQNLYMARGDTLVELVHFNDSAGAPIDDASATYRMTAKYHLTDPDPGVFSVTSTQNAPGQALITVPSSATNTLTTKYWGLEYDVQVTEGNGRVTTVQRGVLYVSPDASRTTP